MGWVGLGWVGLGWVGLGRVGLGGLGWVGCIIYCKALSVPLSIVLVEILNGVRNGVLAPPVKIWD